MFFIILTTVFGALDFEIECLDAGSIVNKRLAGLQSCE